MLKILDKKYHHKHFKLLFLSAVIQFCKYQYEMWNNTRKMKCMSTTVKNIINAEQHYKHYLYSMGMKTLQVNLSSIPTMNGVGESRTSASISGHSGMYGHCQRNGNIICNTETITMHCICCALLVNR